MKAETSPRPISVTIIGGFLGAGKTTLLSHILTSAKDIRLGVLVNDFGDVSIDAELIEEIAGGVMRLTNGCICCTIRNDVTSALFSLMERRTLDHVLIETSGVSDPRAVAESFMEMHKQALIRLDGLVSVVDAENFERARSENKQLAESQVVAADLIVLSKVDLAGEEKTRALETTLRTLAPRARMIRADHGVVPQDVLLAIDRVVEHEHDHDHDHDHAQSSHGYQTWSFRETRPLRWLKLAPVLAQLPPEIYRVKGFLNLEERPGDRILLHVVAGRVHVRTLEPWGARTPQNELVFIGRGFDIVALEDKLRDTY